MTGLLPIVRRVRRPLLPVEPAPVVPRVVGTGGLPTVAEAAPVSAGGVEAAVPGVRPGKAVVKREKSRGPE